MLHLTAAPCPGTVPCLLPAAPTSLPAPPVHQADNQITVQVCRGSDGAVYNQKYWFSGLCP
jgi:hypothetical protein